MGGLFAAPFNEDRTYAIIARSLRKFYVRIEWGERRELNPQPQDPQSCALTRLSYAHHKGIKTEENELSYARRPSAMEKTAMPYPY